jgi:cell wall-associated NlpC family hydrolase
LLAQLGGDGGWEPGPYGEWAGDCVRFAWFAWAANGIVPARGNNATQMGDAYASRLRGGVPPVGALVFYYDATGLGHVGISTGGGRVISTTGYDRQGTPNYILRYTRAGLTYRGWAFP